MNFGRTNTIFGGEQRMQGYEAVVQEKKCKLAAIFQLPMNVRCNYRENPDGNDRLVEKTRPFSKRKRIAEDAKNGDSPEPLKKNQSTRHIPWSPQRQGSDSSHGLTSALLCFLLAPTNPAPSGPAATRPHAQREKEREGYGVDLRHELRGQTKENSEGVIVLFLLTHKARKRQHITNVYVFSLFFGQIRTRNRRVNRHPTIWLI